jgi:hypothetical protein
MSSSARSISLIAERTGSASRRGLGGLGVTTLQAGILFTVQLQMRQSRRHGTHTRLHCKTLFSGAKPASQPVPHLPAEVEEGAAGRQKSGRRSDQTEVELVGLQYLIKIPRAAGKVHLELLDLQGEGQGPGGAGQRASEQN